jgi:type II secretory ATPase GspE/PulE/Tfp pilus assembly ATPase PilB-like protein/CheY-like chemotaxis protein
MMDHSSSARTVRQPWTDRWLLDLFRQNGHPAAERVVAAPSAWEALEAAGATTAEIARAVCDLAGVSAADVSTLTAEQASLLPLALARRYDVVGVRLDGGTLEVATSNPLSEHLERDLAFACARRIRVVIASPTAIRDARERIYRHSTVPRVASRVSWVTPQGPGMQPQAAMRGVAIDALDRIVTDAMDQRASDIHLEPQDGALVVRFRVDGVLHDVTRVPVDIAPLLLSRIKVSAGLDIANRLRPQDGRASMIFEGREVDVRISTLPLGERVEKAVLRLLDASSTSLDLAALGFGAAEKPRLERMLASTEGMVLVTGPTGSGKTTTLYSALRHVQSRRTNIVTVEDPIEYRLDGINQVQVNERAGLTFASALRSILRQDPDVVLIGEIRDAETAGIAVKASMTGHLVLSTLHTNDAPAAIGRLADIGVDVAALADGLNGIIAQRLVRRLCRECSRPATLDELEPGQQLLLQGRDVSRIRLPIGCAACRRTGYRGRMAVAEMLVIDDETRQLIGRSSNRLGLLALARKSGMHTLWDTGVERVLEGATSIAELLEHVTAPVPDGELGQEDVDRLLSDLLGGAPSASGTPQPSPRQTVVTPKGVRTAIPSRQASTLAIAPRNSTDARPRVLIAHETRHRRRTIRDALVRVGCSVIEATDGEAALSYACRLRPDVVITEVALSKLDGIGLLQYIKEEGIVDRVFIYTEQDDPSLHEWARELGATDVLTTEEDVATLATRVRAEFPGVATLVRQVG